MSCKHTHNVGLRSPERNSDATQILVKLIKYRSSWELERLQVRKLLHPRFSFIPVTTLTGGCERPITASWWASPAYGCERTPARGWGRWRTGRGRRRFLRAGWATSAWRAPACCSARCASDPGDASPRAREHETQVNGSLGPLNATRVAEKSTDKVKEWRNLWEENEPDDADLHVQNLLEGFRVTVSQEFNVVINKNHGWFVRGHHHLWESTIWSVAAALVVRKWPHMGWNWGGQKWEKTSNWSCKQHPGGASIFRSPYLLFFPF